MFTTLRLAFFTFYCRYGNNNQSSTQAGTSQQGRENHLKQWF